MTTRERMTFAALVAAAALATMAFLAWWTAGAHVPSNFRGGAHIVDYMLFAVLTLVLVHRPFMDALTWYVSWNIRVEAEVPAPREGLRVAFITTFVPSAEPLELLYACLPAMLTADYPHDVWVLDEGADEQVRDLCARMGVRYFSRHGIEHYNRVDGPFAARTKGGNHNAWYDAHGYAYDVVAQIDTDFVPKQNFLTRTLGYFEDPEVGWVGTPQVYGNGYASFVARGAAQQLFTFYGPIMRGLAGARSANLIGANHVIRVAALKDIGFYAGHLTEDLLTGMQLHAAGWRSHYVHEPLAVGEGPTTWQAYFSQQMRWAFGCIDILFRHSPKLFRRMGRRQAATYWALQQHYFTGIAMALGVALLGAYFFGGLYAADVSLAEVVLWCVPAVALRHAVVVWLQRFHPSPDTDSGLLLAGRVVSVIVWPVYLMAAIGVLRGKRLSFTVTPKGAAAGPRHIPPSVARLHAVIGGFTAACLVAGVLLHRTSLPLMFWAALDAVTLLGFVALVHGTNLAGAGQQYWAKLRARRPRHAFGSQLRPAVPRLTPVATPGELVTSVAVDRIVAEPVS